MNTIKDVVSTLSKKEKYQFQDLILECTNREEQLNKNREITRNNIKRFAVISDKLIKDVHTLLVTSKQMSDHIQNERIKKIPDEHFFKV